MSRQAIEKDTGLEAILFPHVGLDERGLKRALALFERIIVCRPWSLEVPTSVLERAPAVNVRHPPETLTPPSDFKRVLSEHRRWIAQHRDRGLNAFLTVGQNRFEDPESTWEIRKEIRAGRNLPRTSGQEKALEWHLLLHLSFELEEARLASDHALRVLRLAGSPLKEALGEEGEAPGLLEDLHSSPSGPPGEEARLLQTMSAWVGLFGEQLGPQPLLLTFHRDLPALLIQRLAESPGDPSGRSPVLEARFRFPDPSDRDAEDFPAIREGPGRMARRALAELCSSLRSEPLPGPEEILAACRRVESCFGFIEGGAGNVAVTLLALPLPAGGMDRGPERAPLGPLAGGLIALIEETEDDGGSSREGIRPTEP